MTLKTENSIVKEREERERKERRREIERDEGKMSERLTGWKKKERKKERKNKQMREDMSVTHHDSGKQMKRK